MWTALKERLGYAAIGIFFGCVIGVLLWLLIEQGFSRYETASESPAPIITWVQIPDTIGALLVLSSKKCRQRLSIHPSAVSSVTRITREQKNGDAEVCLLYFVATMRRLKSAIRSRKLL